jgi:hypothetical protein
VPSDGNALADILLSRGINGESPKRKRTPHKKSTLTPKTRAPSASRVLGSKTPRTGAPKRASRKSAAAPSDADENNAPPAKKRRDTSKRAKLPEGRKTPGAPLRQVAVGSLYSPCIMCVLHGSINARSGFILRRHGHRYWGRLLSISCYCPTGAIRQPARRRQCVLLYHHNSNANIQLSLLRAYSQHHQDSDRLALKLG